MSLSVIVPSMGRAERVRATRAIEVDGICVPESQAERYQVGNPGQTVIAHSDTVIGLPAKREWIYERFGDVWMIDDDVLCYRDLTDAPGTEGRMSKAAARAMIESIYDLACDLGVYLFSTATIDIRYYFLPQRPFTLTGCVGGGSFGMRAGSGLDFGSKYGIVAAEDMYVSGLNAHRHRMMLKDLRYGFEQEKTMRNPGGQSAHRTAKTEAADLAILTRLFGSAVRPRHERVSSNPRKVDTTRETPSSRSLVIRL